MTALITPQWPLPAGVRACSSLRTGGVSQPPFDSLNLGLHTGDSWRMSPVTGRFWQRRPGFRTRRCG